MPQPPARHQAHMLEQGSAIPVHLAAWGQCRGHRGLTAYTSLVMKNIPHRNGIAFVIHNVDPDRLLRKVSDRVYASRDDYAESGSRLRPTRAKGRPAAAKRCFIIREIEASPGVVFFLLIRQSPCRTAQDVCPQGVEVDDAVGRAISRVPADAPGIFRRCPDEEMNRPSYIRNRTSGWPAEVIKCT